MALNLSGSPDRDKHAACNMKDRDEREGLAATIGLTQGLTTGDTMRDLMTKKHFLLITIIIIITPIGKAVTTTAQRLTSLTLLPT